MENSERSSEQRGTDPKFIWVLMGFLFVAGYFLVLEHKAHLEGALKYLPYLLLLACPLMHLFLHHGHGGHRAGWTQKDGRGEHE